MRYQPAIGLLLALWVPFGASAAEETGFPAVETWAERLLSNDSTPRQRQTALSALGAMAAGDPKTHETREALFTIAEYRLARSEGQLDNRTEQALNAAASLYRDDDRAPRLLLALGQGELDRGDVFAAHVAFRALIEAGGAEDDPALLARSAFIATRAGDMAPALDWAMRLEPGDLDEPERIQLLLARLAAGHALGRFDLALDAVEVLETEHPEDLHINDRALIAAADTYFGVGLLEKAIPLYYRFVSVHPKAYERPRALLTLGQLHARTGQAARAEGTWNWLLEAYPDSPEAHQARMGLLELDGAQADVSKVAEYVAVIKSSTQAQNMLEACETFTERFVGAGMPLELAQALIEVAAEFPPEDSLVGVVTRHCLEEGLESIFGLLESRDDLISVAAIALQAEQTGVTLPREHMAVVMQARRMLGLPPITPGILETALVTARGQIQKEQWEEAIGELERAMSLDRQRYETSMTEAGKLIAEALWRLDRDSEALDRARQAWKTSDPSSAQARSIEVLISDIQFSGGEQKQACAHYRRIAEASTSPWVAAQVGRCETLIAAEAEPS